MKRIIILIIVLMMCFSLCSCSSEEGVAAIGKFLEGMQIHNGDWYYELVNGYEIWRINSRSVVCGKADGENSLDNVINAYITEFCYNDRYVAVKWVSVPEDLSVEIDKSNPIYFIIDTETDKVYGRFDEAEFLQGLDSLNISDLCVWIPTSPAPDGAKYF